MRKSNGCEEVGSEVRETLTGIIRHEHSTRATMRTKGRLKGIQERIAVKTTRPET